MDKELFIANVQYFCQKKGEKPTPACVNAGVGKDFYTNLKKGQTPLVSKVSDLAAYLGVTTSELLGEASPRIGEVIPLEDMELLGKYHRATDHERSIVDLTLEPFADKKKESSAG